MNGIRIFLSRNSQDDAQIDIADKSIVGQITDDKLANSCIGKTAKITVATKFSIASLYAMGFDLVRSFS